MRKLARKSKPIKIHISLAPELVALLDKEAKRDGLKRTQTTTRILSNHLFHKLSRVGA